MSELIFLSHAYDENTPGYGGKKDFFTEPTKCLSQGHSCNQLKITLSNHVGTHIDTPHHFFEKGKNLSDYPANFWIFKNVEMVELKLSPSELITRQHVAGKVSADCDFLILKTNFEQKRSDEIYWKENPGLSADLGDYLRENFPKIKVVGGDFISATCFSKREEGRLAHQSFLSPERKNHPILIIEDMKLQGLSKKPKSITVLPLLIAKADGAPVTILAEL